MSPSIAELHEPAEGLSERTGDSPLATSGDLAQIWKWNETVPPTINNSIHEDFVDFAQKEPTRPAVLSWDGTLSYGELNDLSTRMAHLILKRGVKPGSPVLFCFEKSMWTSLAVLAVMKAGCAFVLTDPVQPEARLGTIAAETQASLVLTSRKYRDLGTRIAPSAQILAVDSDLAQCLSSEPLDNLPPVQGDFTMYIIFTSGSTGKPKGVVLSHANYTSGAIPRARIVGYRQHTRVLDFASYAFDVSIDCMLCTFATGGCICIPSEEDRVNNLSGAIREMRVNMVHTTPSVARILDPDIIPSLEVLGLGGEAISPHDASNWRQQTQVVIAYGPSECTVGCAFNNKVRIGGSYTSLGKGVGGLLWIVDPSDHNVLMQIGETGELLVEGPIVGQGYLNEPEKTAAVYIESPSWLSHGSEHVPGRHSRLYKTGDLVYHDPDGSGAVVFVGRKDQQVKLRGQRVELGEVEHHVRQRLSQKVSVVAEVIRPAGNGDPTLVAFVADKPQPEKGEPLDAPVRRFSEELRQTLAETEKSLKEEVPKYMVPAAFIPISEIPITVSGKTDRKQLQVIGSTLSRKELAKLRFDASESQVPRTDIERKLRDLWIPLLGEGPEIGRDDNFFALGGDSLKAMKLVANAREAGFSLTVADIFRQPSLAQMASNLGKVPNEEDMEILPFSMIGSGWGPEQDLSQFAELCDVTTDSIEDAYPCTPLQEGLMALSAKVSEAYVAQRVVELSDPLEADLFCEEFNQTARDSPILRTRILQIPGRGLLQVVVREQPAWHHAENLSEYLSSDRNEPMELGKPLMRVAIVNAGGRVYFVLTMHHALYDGWSMPLIVERLNRTHQGSSIRRPADFKHFVRYLCDVDRSAAADFWRDYLQGSSTHQFPTLPEPRYQTRADSLLEKYVPLAKVSASTSTLATAIRVAWAVVASQLTGSEDVLFGETLTGRNAPIPGVEQIEGPMITTVPVRIRLDQSPRVSDILKSLQQHTLDRIPHEHMGLQNIRKLSSDARKACDLRTGLVLHPYVDSDEAKKEQGPASGLVPASDTEAAQEALKFNSYALMLVCTLDPRGVLVMASFDTQTVSHHVMQMALESFGVTLQQLCESPGTTLSEIQTTFATFCPSLRDYRIANYKIDESSSIQPVERPPPKNVQKEAVTNGVHGEIVLNEKESVLRNILSRILNLEPQDISPDDSFFDLGGDSIGAMKLASELRQHGFALNVAQVFELRRLRDMAESLKEIASATIAKVQAINQSYTLLDLADPTSFIENGIRPLLLERDWQILDVLPARPLQDIAVRGTTDLPRYSARYEMIFFDKTIDGPKLSRACRQLVSTHEILRTVFVRIENQCFGVVVEDISVPFSEYAVDNEVESFAHALCDLDVQTLMPLGQPFLKFMHIRSSEGTSCLTIRISHAQYDEMCLPLLLQQLSALYGEQAVEPSLPFSNFVQAVHNEALPQSIAYWRKLLAGSTLTTLTPPASPPFPTPHSPISLTHKLNISHRPKTFTLATLPTAAWALTLAQRLRLSDITFGEVVSGRNLSGLPNGEAIIGPCWQYIPVRVQFQPSWTAQDLLSAVQHQHISSAPFSAPGLSEILEQCVDAHSFDPGNKRWFDSVVHQAVQGVQELDFGNGLIGKTETVYPHAEPLREWKVQSFVEDDGDAMTLEIVTLEAWKNMGAELLAELVGNFEGLMEGSENKRIWEI